KPPCRTSAPNNRPTPGPPPRMPDPPPAGARRTFDTAIVANPDGTVTDRLAYPLIAFREIIANTLIHRDLDYWSQAFAIEVRLRRDRLIVTNPGGLYRLTLHPLSPAPLPPPPNRLPLPT